MEAWVADASPRIWERRPSDIDALHPTVGIGRHATRIEVERQRGNDSPHAGELDQVIGRHSQLDNVPITGPGPDIGSFGATGDAERIRSLIARIVVEAAILHSPKQLRIWVAATSPGWEWCRWLPHVAGERPSHDVAGAAEMLAAAARDIGDSAGTDVLHLVVVPETSRRLDVDARSLVSRADAHCWSSEVLNGAICRAGSASSSTSTGPAAER